MIEAAIAGAAVQGYSYRMAEAAKAMQRSQDALMAQLSLYTMDYGQVYTPKPCPYCKRDKQVSGRKSCDGCGAPR